MTQIQMVQTAPSGQMLDLRLDKIIVGTRKRSLDVAKVNELADSIAQIGLIHSITVTSDYRLITGYHRLEAFKALGRETIPAIVHDVNGLAAELAEIDENLIRNKLTALEEGEHLLRRDEILEALGKRAQAGQGRPPQKGEDSSPLKTTADIAKDVGLSERVAQQRKQIARNLDPEVKEAIRGTPLANKNTTLLRLSQLDAVLQKSIVDTCAHSKSEDRADKLILRIWREEQQRKWIAKNRAEICAEINAVSRDPIELKLEEEAILAWKSLKFPARNKGIESILCLEMQRNVERLCPDKLKDFGLYSTPSENELLKKKRQWLKENSAEARIAWLRKSIARAGEVPADLEKRAKEFTEAKRAGRNAEAKRAGRDAEAKRAVHLNLTQGLMAIFLRMPPRLMEKFWRDAIKRYHPDKLPPDIDEQERQDCLEIARVLLEAKKFFEAG